MLPDEANSIVTQQCFGAFKQVKLVVVTHNQKQAQAAVLYGVTIGRDGGSKLYLSDSKKQPSTPPLARQ